MRIAIIENGVVINVIVSSETPDNGVASNTANIGDAYDGSSFTAPSPPPVNYSMLAQSQLSVNDKVAIRCAKAQVAYPAEWLAYDIALRAIVISGTGPLPDAPTYPSGT